MKRCRLLFAGIFATLAGVAAENVAKEQAKPHPLVWDAMEKTVEAKDGELAADFSFKVTNSSNRTVTILSVSTSCGCTVAEMPATPWVLPPGASGTLPATVDFSGKEGTLTKSLFIESSAGDQTLLIHVKIPVMDSAARARNQELARADRQSVFRGDCASCHATPGSGKTGEELFRGVCLNCHTPMGRASMVPDLFTARNHRDVAWWRTWIADGKEGTLMPAFANKHGGSLTDAQVESLVEFAVSHLPTEARTN